MKKLKCESCGANLKVDENKEYAYCEYCNLKYKLNEDINHNIHITLDEDIKESLKKGGKIATKIGIGYLIMIAIIFLIVISIVIFTFSKVNDGFDTKTNNLPNLTENENVQEITDEFEIRKFNGTFEMYSGTQPQMFVERLLEEVTTNNKKNKDKIITVIYKKNTTNKPDEITNIKHSLNKNARYEVVLDYSDKGFVNQVTIQDIK